jgi:hypothetical protein
MRTLVYLLWEKKPTKKLHTKAKGVRSKGPSYNTSSSLKPYIVLIFWALNDFNFINIFDNEWMDEWINLQHEYEVMDR